MNPEKTASLLITSQMKRRSQDPVHSSSSTSTQNRVAGIVSICCGVPCQKGNEGDRGEGIGVSKVPL